MSLGLPVFEDVHMYIPQASENKQFTNLFLIPGGKSFFPTSVAGFMQAKSLKSSCLVVGVTSLPK